MRTNKSRARVIFLDYPRFVCVRQSLQFIDVYMRTKELNTIII